VRWFTDPDELFALTLSRRGPGSDGAGSDGAGSDGAGANDADAAGPG
jgi:hypothetical protein